MKKIFFSIALLLFVTTSIRGQIQVFGEQIPLDSTINTIYDELNVVLSPDDNYLFFTRALDPLNKGGKLDRGDIWISELTSEGIWSAPKNPTELNDENLNQVIGFLDPRTLLSRNKTDLMTHYLYNGKWWEPKPFEIPYFQPKSDHLSACVSHDGKYILFGMESFGSYGVEDLYFSKKGADGAWSGPKNLGSILNTDYQEISPFLAPDGKTLLFASNGHGGEGSFDLFVTTRLDDTWLNWTKPVNLGKGANTIGKESSFIFSLEEEFAYLISTQNSEGYGDIKKIKIEPKLGSTDAVATVEEEVFVENKIVLTGKVVNMNTEEPLVGAEILFESLDGLKRFKANTNSNGYFVINVTDELDYDFKVSAMRFLSYEEEVSKADLDQIKEKTVKLRLIEEGVTVSLDHVLFERATADLLPGSEKELNLVVEMMKLNPEVSIFLGGHTDNQGNESANLQLSQDRVETVQKYLSKHGISRKRIDGQGFGGSKPRASNADPESRQLNRRVEFTIHLKQ